MLTKLWIQNFKQFEDVEIELGQSVVFIGPNNSGKTTALQALALLDIGLKAISGKLDQQTLDSQAINRYDVEFVPVSDLSSLWYNRKTTNHGPINLSIRVEGLTGTELWSRDVFFEYVNDGGLVRCPVMVAHSRFSTR